MYCLWGSTALQVFNDYRVWAALRGEHWILGERMGAADIGCHPLVGCLDQMGVPTRMEFDTILEDHPSLARPFHIGTATRRACKSHTRFDCHMLNAGYPSWSIWRTPEGFAMSAPELAFMQACKALPTIRCVRLACELCAAHVVGVDAGRTRVLRVPAYTTPGELARRMGHVINRVPPNAFTHYPAMMTALGYAIPMTSSPAEVTVGLMLTLPESLGGFGLPGPLPRAAVPARGPEGADDAISPHKAGLLWPDAQVALTFRAPTGDEDAAEDDADMTEQVDGRWTILRIRTARVPYARTRIRLARRIAGLLGVPLEIGEVTDWQARHHELARYLLDPT